MISFYSGFKKITILKLIFLFTITLLPINGKAAPYQAGVVLTFDDYYVDGWYDYFLQRNDVAATFFVSHWKNTIKAAEILKLKGLRDAGYEIGYHTYTHKGIGSDYGYDPARIQDYLNEEIIPGLTIMQDNGFNPVSFAYPFGETSDAYNAAVRTYFPYLRETHSDNSKQLFEIDEIYHNEAKNYDILAGDGTDNIYDNNIAEVEQALIRAKNNNEILTLYSHQVIADGSPDAGYDFAIRVSKLDQIINKAKQLGLKFYTFKEAYQAGNHGLVTTSIVNKTVQFSWSGIACDFIGVVPANQSQWTTGMPGITADGTSTGVSQITVPNPLNAFEYKLIFYKNSKKVFTSDPFIMLNLGSAPLPPEIISPNGVSSRQNGSVVLRWNAVLGAESYDYEGYKTDANGNINYNQLIFNQSITIEAAGCVNGGVCSVTVPVSVQYGSWSIRANFENLESDYSDMVFFSLIDEPIPDTVAPVITVTGENPVTVLFGSNYVDVGATATDNVDLLVTVNTDISSVNMNNAGTYTVLFTATDIAGNAASSTRTVIVKDITPPVITLQGSNSITVYKGAIYTDSGATATDNNDPSVSVHINILAVDTSVTGTYQVVFTATDSSNNTATAYREVVVVNNEIFPPTIISPNGLTTINNNTVIFRWNFVQGATQYDYKISKTTDGVIDIQPLISRTVTAEVAGCLTQGICQITETLTIKQGAWSIRTHKGVSTSEYSVETYFTLKESEANPAAAAALIPIIQMLLLD